MTPFAALCALAGMSLSDTAEFLRVRLDTVKSWSSGRNRCPDGPINELRGLIANQENAATQFLAQIERHDEGGNPEMPFPVDDAEARDMGVPCVGAWRVVVARVIVRSSRSVNLVPRNLRAAAKAEFTARAGR